MSWHENTWPINDILWRKTTSHWWIPFTEGHGEIWCVLLLLAWTSCWKNIWDGNVLQLMFYDAYKLVWCNSNESKQNSSLFLFPSSSGSPCSTSTTKWSVTSWKPSPLEWFLSWWVWETSGRIRIQNPLLTHIQIGTLSSIQPVKKNDIRRAWKHTRNYSMPVIEWDMGCL